MLKSSCRPFPRLSVIKAFKIAVACRRVEAFRMCRISKIRVGAAVLAINSKGDSSIFLVVISRYLSVVLFMQEM